MGGFNSAFFVHLQGWPCYDDKVCFDIISVSNLLQAEVLLSCCHSKSNVCAEQDVYPEQDVNKERLFMKISGVLFDVDGTILDTERINMKAWKLAAKDWGFDLGQEALRRTRAISKEEAARIYKSYCGDSFDYDLIFRRKSEISEQLLYSMKPEELFKPGAVELFEYLDRRGIKKALATSTPKNLAYPHLEHAGILDQSLCGRYPALAKFEPSNSKSSFDTIVTGDEVTRAKPDPEIFLEAARRLGVDPKECIVMEDSYAGVRAGKAAGSAVFMIPDQAPIRQEDRPFITRELKSLLEAPEAIEELERE